MPAFTTIIIPVQGEAGMTEAITGQQALLGLIIPGIFRADWRGANRAKVQLIIDGRRSNGGQVAAGYISQVIARWQSEGKGNPSWRYATSTTPTSSSTGISCRRWWPSSPPPAV